MPKWLFVLLAGAILTYVVFRTQKSYAVIVGVFTVVATALAWRR